MLTKEKIKFIEFMMNADVLRFGDFVTKSGRRRKSHTRGLESV